MTVINDDMDATQTTVPVASPTTLAAGFYTIGSENIEVLGPERTETVGDKWDRIGGLRHKDVTAPKAALCIRGIGGSTAATHSSGATLTRYYPEAPGGAGGSTPTIAAVLTAGSNAGAQTITNLGAPTNPADAARLQDVGGSGGFSGTGPPADAVAGTNEIAYVGIQTDPPGSGTFKVVAGPEGSGTTAALAFSVPGTDFITALEGLYGAGNVQTPAGYEGADLTQGGVYVQFIGDLAATNVGPCTIIDDTTDVGNLIWVEDTPGVPAVPAQPEGASIGDRYTDTASGTVYVLADSGWLDASPVIVRAGSPFGSSTAVTSGDPIPPLVGAFVGQLYFDTVYYGLSAWGPDDDWHQCEVVTYWEDADNLGRTASRTFSATNDIDIRHEDETGEVKAVILLDDSGVHLASPSPGLAPDALPAIPTQVGTVSVSDFNALRTALIALGIITDGD